MSPSAYWRVKAAVRRSPTSVSCRVASHENAIYIDLGGAEWEVIEITAAGWSVVQNPPVRFRRTTGMLEIPRPLRVDRAPDHLRGLINSGIDGGAQLLMTAWLLAAMRPSGPYPVLVLNSEHGSGKTTASRVVRALIDPNEAPVRAQPKDSRDLMIAAENSWVIALDNLSHLPDWLSDAICRLSTGGGFSTRLLYTNEEEALFNAQRPVILNGIDDIVTRGDLLDRSLMIELPKIPDNKRLTEREFWSRFDDQRAGILGFLLDGVSARYEIFRTFRFLGCHGWLILPRDVRCGTRNWLGAGLLPWSLRGQSRRGQRCHARQTRRFARYVLATGDFTGTATSLLGVLDARASESEKKRDSWPKSHRACHPRLRRLTPNLRTAGLEVSFDRKSDSSNRDRLITITRGTRR